MDYNKAKLAKLELKSIDSIEVNHVISLFKKYRPTDYDDICMMGFKLKFKGDGLFRHSYRINNLPVIVKLPKLDGDMSWEEGVTHSSEEVRKIKLIKKIKKYRVLRRYLPEVLYYDKFTGIMLMPEYHRLSYKEASIFTEFVGNLLKDLGRDSDNDMHCGNVAYDDDEERYVIIDLGYL